MSYFAIICFQNAIFVNFVSILRKRKLLYQGNCFKVEFSVFRFMSPAVQFPQFRSRLGVIFLEH